MEKDNATAYADLHVHTTYSDGMFSPEKVVRTAIGSGLRAIGVTDHDCIDGIEPCIEAARGTALEIIPGVEISAAKDEIEIHVLGYFIDWKDPSLLRKLQRIREDRVKRLKKMVALLCEHGAPVRMEKVFSKDMDGTVGRLHLARVMVEENVAKNTKEAFSRYIGDGKPCHVRHRRLEYTDAIDMIREAGGVPILAHPGSIARDEYLGSYVGAGLRGIEAFHTRHSPAASDRYLAMAEKYGLLVTGGSDCHGMIEKSGILIGKVKVEYRLVVDLREEAEKIRAQNRGSAA